MPRLAARRPVTSPTGRASFITGTNLVVDDALTKGVQF